ncbi:apolipoprotein A-IV [Amia ocellicauda]|uniref:apolipoprotein A-IV n=1 Tax=Amia ocellicauda TaxID=2972642 RepID=UPI003463C315
MTSPGKTRSDPPRGVYLQCLGSSSAADKHRFLGISARAEGQSAAHTRLQEKTNMHLKIVILALTFAVVAGVRTALWDYLNEGANQVSDKSQQTEITKESNGLWKNHLEKINLYSQDFQELHHKLSLDSEKLRVRLMRELHELREKFSPYSHQLQHEGAQIRDRLAPYAQRMQGVFNRNTQELCSHLNTYIRGLEVKADAPQGDAPYQEVLQRIEQALDHSNQKLGPYLEEFRVQTARAVGELREGVPPSSTEEELQQHLQAVSDRLVQNAEGFRAGLQGRAGELREVLARLLTSARPLGEELSHSVARFCQDSSSQAQRFSAGLEQQLQELSPARASVPLVEDFSAKLSALLAEIQQNLN